MRKKKKHLPLISATLIFFIIMWIAFFCDYSFWRRHKVTRELEEIQQKIVLLEKENILLEQKNELLQDDPKTWEREARNIGMQKKGEKIIIFQESKRADK